VLLAGVAPGSLRVGVAYKIAATIGVVLIKGGNHKLVVRLAASSVCACACVCVRAVLRMQEAGGGRLLHASPPPRPRPHPFAPCTPLTL
jgi:hypothetical protein